MPANLSVTDANLHDAINKLEVVVLQLEALKLKRPDDIQQVAEVNKIMECSIDCGELLHQARSGLARNQYPCDIPILEIQ
jgi:hypothetical protein